MKLSKVLDKFPKTNERLYEWMKKNNYSAFYFSTSNDIISFLQYHNIIPYIEFDVDRQKWMSWVITKHEDGHWSGGGRGAYDPQQRDEAEENAIILAFEILEDLNGE